MNFPRNLYMRKARSENHSLSFVRDTLDYADNLMRNNLPVIFSPKHFALLCGIEYSKLQSIVANRNYHYSHYLISKKRGGYRSIMAPYRDIKELQKWIKINILDKIQFGPCVTGFVKERSILYNAKIHENQEVILNLDLSNFFETINERRVYGVFKSLDYAHNVAFEFAKICTASTIEVMSNNDPDHANDPYIFYMEPVLIQGAPTSPGISNIICKRLDKRLLGLANKLGVSYSRYADDITFSGKAEDIPKISLIKKIIEEEKFAINWDKVGKYKVGQRQMVTGLLINDGVRIPQKYKRDIYRHLHFCKKYGAVSHFNRINPDKGYGKDWLLGKILFVHSIEPVEAKKMMAMVQQIDWGI